LGIVFALSHYIGNILVGVIMRFYKKDERETKTEAFFSPHLLVKAFRNMHGERIRNKRPIGIMLGDAVQSSVSTLLMVGGYIILFSVFNRLLDAMGGTDVLAIGFNYLLSLLDMTEALGSAIVPGLFEITVGTKRVSDLGAPLQEAVMVTAFILGFGGFSIQAQVASILAEVKLSAKPFFIGRIFHGLFSAFAAGVLFNLLSIHQATEKHEAALPVMKRFIGSFDYLQTHPLVVTQWSSLVTLCTLILYILFIARLFTNEHSH
jgi:sporulation integral membrane protein YlbJ